MKINILGIRGIPASHGGFETFAAKLAPYLVNKGHSVTVYCQEESGEPGPWIDDWHGITRVHFRPKRGGPLGTIEFDLSSIIHASKNEGINLVLGYNTALFSVYQRLMKKKVVMNMDGIEWKRDKWNWLAKLWFFINEIIGSNTAHVAIADHPEISNHLKKRCFKKPVIIPYGSDEILSGSEEFISQYGVSKNKYFISIARIEPENSILELVTAFSSLKTDYKLVVLGNFLDDNEYHSKVKHAGNDNVLFVGAIYDSKIVSSLRYYAKAYLHGHQVGGTNPSLVEALGAGNAIIAHDNVFNRWVTDNNQFYFNDIPSAIACLELVINQCDLVSQAKIAAKKRHFENFKWQGILESYEKVLLSLS